MTASSPRLARAEDPCPSVEDEPLSAAEWRVYAHWLTHYPQLRSEPGLAQVVREVCWQAEPRVMELLLREPKMKAGDALVKCVNPPLVGRGIVNESGGGFDVLAELKRLEAEKLELRPHVDAVCREAMSQVSYFGGDAEMEAHVKALRDAYGLSDD